MAEIHIQSVSFEPDGSMVIAYVSTDDIRVNGSVALQHGVRLDAAHPDYADDIDGLQGRARKVLINALDDFDGSEPWIPPVDEDDNEDADQGMGM